METLQEIKSVNRQEREIDRFKSAFRGCQSEPCHTLRDKYQSEILDDIRSEIVNGRKYLIPLLKELTEEYQYK